MRRQGAGAPDALDGQYLHGSQDEVPDEEAKASAH